MSNKECIPRGPKPYLRKDPAIEEWAHYRENTHRYFRMTPKNARWGLFMMVFLPFVGYKSIAWAQKKSEENNPYKLRTVHITK